MNTERTLKIVLEYDGSDFAGWQVQPGSRTVQQTVENSLEQVLNHPVRIIAAGRTDAGVHAKGQVAGFKTTSLMKPERILRAMNGVLPDEVTAINVRETCPDFNARFDAVSRTYRYTLSGRRLSIGRAYAWHVKYSLSEKLLKQATSSLKGKCDLRGFSKGRGCTPRLNREDDFSTVILKNSWTFEDNLMIFEISAIRFFHHAVRSIVGSAVETAREKVPANLIQSILESGDRSLAGPTAPAAGLCLLKVDYGEGQ